VINANLPPIWQRFRNTAFDRSEIAVFGTPLVYNSPTEGFPWDDLRKFSVAVIADGQGTKCRRNIAENCNRLSRAHERYRQTDDKRQTDG